MSLLSRSAMALSFLLTLTLKITLVLAVTWVLVSALRGHSAAMRHRVWALGVLGALALPLLTTLLPAWYTGVLGNAAVHLEMISATEEVTTPVERQSPLVEFMLFPRFRGPADLPSWALRCGPLGSALILSQASSAGLARGLGWISRSLETAVRRKMGPVPLEELSETFSVRCGRSVRLLECRKPRGDAPDMGCRAPEHHSSCRGSGLAGRAATRRALPRTRPHPAQRLAKCVQVCAELLRGLALVHPTRSPGLQPAG